MTKDLEKLINDKLKTKRKLISKNPLIKKDKRLKPKKTLFKQNTQLRDLKNTIKEDVANKWTQDFEIEND